MSTTPRAPIYDRLRDRLELVPCTSTRVLALHGARLTRLAGKMGMRHVPSYDSLPDRLGLLPWSSTRVLARYGAQLNPSASTTGTGASA
jgi:hypothetical protein